MREKKNELDALKELCKKVKTEGVKEKIEKVCGHFNLLENNRIERQSAKAASVDRIQLTGRFDEALSSLKCEVGDSSLKILQAIEA